MLVISGNPSLRDAERTFFSDPSPVGSTTLVVKDSRSYAVNDYILLGSPGGEKAERVKVTAIPSDSSFTTTATLFDHSSDDPIYLMRYNQIRIYRLAASGDTPVLLTVVDTNWADPMGETVYDDLTGTASNYYKVSYYNDVSTLESSLSDEIPGIGYGRDTVSYLIDAVLQEVKDINEQTTTRSEILRWANDCDDEVHSRKPKGWSFWKTETTLDMTADSRTVSLASLTYDFDKLDHLRYAYTSENQAYDLRFVPLQEFERRYYDTTADSSDELGVFSLDFDGNSLLLDPPPATTLADKLTLYYYYKQTAYNSEGDTLAIPMFNVYFNYCVQRWHSKKGSADTVVRRWETKFERNVLNLIRSEPKEVGHLQSMEYRTNGVRRYFKH